MAISNGGSPATPGEATRRRTTFHYDFGQQGDFAADVLRDCLIASHRFVADIVGDEPADAGFDAMIGCIFEREVKEHGWEGALHESDGQLYSDLVMGQVFHDLNAYAHEGIALNGGATTEQRRELLGRLIERAERFYARIPFKLWGIAGKDLEKTMLLARGRWALDNGEPIEPRALAIFAGVSLQRIRNMMSKTEALLPSVRGRVPAKDALNLLRHRLKSFRPSVWQEQETFDDLPAVSAGRLEEVVFAPIGADGSVFHPGLRRDGKYMVGDDAEDLEFEDFGVALDELQRMVTPVWRRPTPQGLWTRVRGVRWERMTMEDLERTAEPIGTG